MIGPGKYDQLCTYVREQAKALGAIVLIIEGKGGSGFSCQLSGVKETMRIPSMLRQVADQIEADFKKGVL